MAYKKKTDKTEQVEQTAPVAVAADTITDDDLLPASARRSTPAEPVALPTLPTPANGVFTAADVAELVRSAVQAAVASVTQAGNNTIADQISKALTGHMGPRRVGISEVGEPKTPFNPEGKKRELKANYYQNFSPIQERFVSDGEIEMLHALVPGSYGTPDLPISVVMKKRLDGGKSNVYIIHPDGKDARLRMKNYAANFHQMLVRLVQEAKEQRAQRRAEALALLQEEGVVPSVV